MNSELLRTLLAKKQPLLLPGVYDGISAQLVKKSDFPAAYVTGAGLSMSILGQPDMNTVSYQELFERVWQISNVFQGPLVVDIDTGFGSGLNIARLIRDFTRLDIAAVQIEDQASPKRCGHLVGKQVVSVEEMQKRIQAIMEVRDKNGPLIVARTDARGPLGFDEALSRAQLFGGWGADLIFIEGLKSLDEIRTACSAISAPMVYNNAEGGASPYLSCEELARYGFAVAIYPNSLARGMARSGMEVLRHLKESGSTLSYLPSMYTHKELFHLFDSEQWLDLADRLKG